MGYYILRRLLASIPVVILVGVMTFSILHIAPGDPAVLMAGEEATPADVEAMRVALGFDKPFIVQFGKWSGRLLQGDLGTSIFSQHTIVSLMKPRIEPTLSLAIIAISLSIIIGVPMGVLAAWNQGSFVDRGVMVFAVLGFSIPVFWLGFLFIWAFAVKLHLFPAVGFVSITDGVFPFLRSLTLPALANAIPFSALVARMTRSTMVEVMQEDYIRTARAKGLTERVVNVRHGLRNAAIPIVTVVGLVFAGLVGGAVVTETVFAIPGLGRLLVDGVVRRDYPIVQAMLMVVAVSYVFVNLAVDITYAFLDPRIRY
ncbi:MAG TPA: ABC transporter permease [Gammaproteobacteria bacterium]|nr:ABC transporter permease [Gammaproteobacteria bacterium]